MYVYIPVAPILLILAIWVGIGVLLYIPLDMWVGHKLAKVNQNMDTRLRRSVKRFFTHPMDTFMAVMLWPVVLFEDWRA